MYCRTCGRTEPFNPSTATDTVRHVLEANRPLSRDPLQVYAWGFICQGCKGPPEVVLIRRDGLKLTLSGRAPIEHVDVPKVIPKDVSQYYSGAIVAHQSGQTLAGLFMLRTCVEQWVRKGRPTEERTEVSMERYQESLPNDFKARFPSLPKIYTDLSTPLHSAAADVELFEKARREIVEHFDARRVFKLRVKPAGKVKGSDSPTSGAR